MVDASLLETIHALPKIELHRHLEGSVRIQTLIDIAQEYGIEMPEYAVETLRPFVQMMPYEPRNTEHFMGKFHTLRQFYRSLGVIQRITYEAIADAAEDNIKYLELRFTPAALSNIINVSYSEIVDAVCQATTRATTDYDIQVGLIVSMNRHETLEQGQMALEAALQYQERHVVGLDLAGLEKGHSANPFRDIFRRAKAEGLGITVHAGEWLGAESVWEAVGNLGAVRVGHGIRSLEDPGIVGVLVERGITLEVCPSSNVDSGVVESLEAHPLRELHIQNVLITINTDDPLISNITLTDEIVRAIEQMAFTLDEVKQLTVQAAKSTFLPESEREALVTKFESWFAADSEILYFSSRLIEEAMLQIGEISIHLINDCTVLVDGGGAFGLVPRVLWERVLKPDENNLVPMTQTCLLVQAGGRNIIIDTGLGYKMDEKARSRWHIARPDGGLLGGLERLGLKPDNIDMVINTHLHVDHASGNTIYAENGQVIPLFPRAEYVTQRREYEDAMQPNERTRATYFLDNYQPLVASGQMRLLDGDSTLVPGISGIITRGHTPAHMSIRFESAGQHAAFLCDLASYAVHFERLGWMTAYDVEPLETLETKRKWQEWALETQAVLIFPHDAFRPVGRLIEDADGKRTIEALAEPYV